MGPKAGGSLNRSSYTQDTCLIVTYVRSHNTLGLESFNAPTCSLILCLNPPVYQVEGIA